MGLYMILSGGSRRREPSMSPKPFFSGGSVNEEAPQVRYEVPRDAAKPDGQPRPYRFEVLRKKRVGNYLLVRLHYPDCTTYSGEKIALYEFDSWTKAAGKGMIDPHFLEEHPSPLARFEPTERGWELALKLANHLKSS